jgi:AAA domain
MINALEKTHTSNYGPALTKMLTAFPHAREKHNGWYEHSDNPRFDFRVRENGTIAIHSWTGRTVDEILEMGGINKSDISLNGKKYTGPIKDALDLLDLAIAKRIDWRLLFNLGLRNDYNYRGRRYVKIPYYLADGTEHTKVKVRKAIDGKYKHCWDEGTPGAIIPYGLDKLSMGRDTGYIIIGEGESDAWTCWVHKVPFLGIPGANNETCFSHLDINMLPPKIYILQEPDQAIKLLSKGQGFYKSVHNTLRNYGYKGEIFCIDFEKATGYKDPSDMHIKLWDKQKISDFDGVIERAISQAIPATDKPGEPYDFAIKDERILKALSENKMQMFYALAPEIAEMDDLEQSRIKVAARSVWGPAFPSREFDNLLKSAKLDNERKKHPGPDFITAYDLMKLHFDPVDFVVPDILPTGLIVLGGKQKIGKSWLDLNICLSVASGGIALGRWQVKQGDVLYMALEDHQRRLQDRLGQLLVAPGEVPPQSLTIVTKWRRMDEGGLEDLENWITQHSNARLVMIDPWVLVKPKSKTRAGETGYDVEYKALEGVKKLADQYKICILIQFHLRKQVADDPFDELNATTGVTACADGFISLKRARGEEEGTLFASGRDYKEEVNLAVGFKAGMWEVLGEGATAEYYGLSQERRAVIDLLSEAVQPMMPKDIANLLSEKDGTIRKLLLGMKSDEQVKWVEEDKQKGTPSGYISFIPSPKKQNKESTNQGNDGNGGNSGNGGNGGNALLTVEQSVTDYQDTALKNTDDIGSSLLTVEQSATDVTTVTTVTTVTVLPQDESTPKEYQPLYAEYCQKVDSLRVETPLWCAKNSGYKNTFFAKAQHKQYTRSLLCSDDVSKINAAIEAMKNTLGVRED